MSLQGKRAKRPLLIREVIPSWSTIIGKKSTCRDTKNAVSRRTAIVVISINEKCSELKIDVVEPKEEAATWDKVVPKMTKAIPNRLSLDQRCQKDARNTFFDNAVSLRTV